MDRWRRAGVRSLVEHRQLAGEGTLPAVPPGTGDQLVFPASVAQKTADNNLGTNIQFQSITIQDSGYDLTGNALSLTSGGLNYSPSSGDSTYGIATTFTTPAVFQCSAGTLNVTGQITLNANETFYVDWETQSAHVVRRRHGDRGLTKDGTGDLAVLGEARRAPRL